MRMACSVIVVAAVLAPLPLAAQSQLPRPKELPPAGSKGQPAPAAKPQQQQQQQQQQKQQTQQQPQQQDAPKIAPAKPYKPVAVKLPAPMSDASFEEFRKQIANAARKKDQAALAKLVVAQGFFWESEAGDKADKKKSGIDNLVAALGLGKKDGDGWDMLGGYSSEPTAMPFGDKKDVFCAPADPEFDEKALEEVAKATGTDPGEWGYPVAPNVEVRSSAQANAAVTEKLGLHFVRVIPDNAPPPQGQPPMLKIVTPSGKTGFAPADALSPLGNDQLCYMKESGSWKITGFIGGE